MMGGKTGAHFTTNNTSPTFTRGRASVNDIHAIALDGDKLKPRVDQRKGGNGFGVNEDGAGYTLTGVDRHGVAYGIDQQDGKGGANSTEGVAPTVLSDSHGTPHGVAYKAKRTWWNGADVATTTTTTGHNQLMPLKHSEVCRTLTGNHDDRVTDTDTSVVVSTNSNGEDVAATLTRDSRMGGGVRPHSPRGFCLDRFGQYGDREIASAMKSRDYKDHTDLVVHEKEGADGE